MRVSSRLFQTRGCGGATASGRDAEPWRRLFMDGSYVTVTRHGVAADWWRDEGPLP
jgi:hypothetical protein